MESDTRNKDINIVLFGPGGAGKSSLVNLMAGEYVAETSDDVKPCTLKWEEHHVKIADDSYNIFDTIRVAAPQLGIPQYLDAVENAHGLIQKLEKKGGIDLLMFCMRAGPPTDALLSNYRLFNEFLCEKKVPIVIVITWLEDEVGEMDAWWTRNKFFFHDKEFHVDGHACITAIRGNCPERHEQSRTTIYKLVKEFTADGQKRTWKGGDNILVLLMQKLRELLSGKSRSKDIVPRLIKKCGLSPDVAKHRNKNINIVLFGQGGAGKSSLVNLMAGEYVAKTSSDVTRCTLKWEEYPVKFDGASYNIFDTVGLEEPQLGIPQYLDAVENTHTLIQKLERQGGIDLLIFCMRAGRLTATIQSNYRLFNEFLCEKKVPIVMVITYLENEVGEMDAWWKRNQETLRHQEFHVDGHACITAIRGNFPERHEQSGNIVRKLVKEVTAGGQKRARKPGGDELFMSLMQKLRGLLLGKPRSKKDKIVPRLIKRCGLSPDVAKQLADRIKKDMVVEGAI
ncbi:uncharacterized protein F5891DRAFT_1143407 [Suillus fuscotomentosus]|uniref:G domain-containing protein n=1 Tax=Suillus fuscotomentosus TaxID=1912939 RepID=A0AAD4HN42_9AGAM|nr:uncharacterized protein F5891DRAFT_1143407 [Suillus fuscotomentosus]KAG1902381.1 hypothetical protein F5891DRAFT_1143407 [Suillus fuscotomentosus]